MGQQLAVQPKRIQATHWRKALDEVFRAQYCPDSRIQSCGWTSKVFLGCKYSILGTAHREVLLMLSCALDWGLVPLVGADH